MKHSNIVGGSTAKRVLACPGSIQLVKEVPPLPSSKYADEGTRLHELISQHLMNGGSTAEPKIIQALELLDELDPMRQMEYKVEASVDFPGIYDAFGSVDLIGRLGDTAIILDWKFGDGVPVEAEENEQLMFYAAAAMNTVGPDFAFHGAANIELVIIQPPYMRRWRTTFSRIDQFVIDMQKAVRLGFSSDPPFAIGDHCRWCPAKQKCPLVSGEIQRAKQIQLKKLKPVQIAERLKTVELLEAYTRDLRKIAEEMLTEGLDVPGWKLVPKQARRQWTANARAELLAAGFKESDITELRSPAQVEKIGRLPDGLTVAVSSGNTIAPEDDPRPRVIDLKRHLGKLL